MVSILCVDDDRYLTDILLYALQRERFDVTCVHTGGDAIAAMRNRRPELVLLDANLPDMSGFKVLSVLRAFSRVPIIMVTARTRDEDMIASFEQGADDYITKPFSLEVLAARVRAVLRRSAHTGDGRRARKPRYELAGCVFDHARHEIRGTDIWVGLTATESRILHLLQLHQEQVLSAEQIRDQLWDWSSESAISVVKTHIHHLREKIATLPGSPQPIVTLPGRGYMLRRASTSGATASRIVEAAATN